MTTKSPSLEVISKPSDHSQHERRRLPRLNLAGEQFRLDQSGKIYSVSDLSAEGMALHLLESEDLKKFPIATKLTGTLNLHGAKHSVRAKVRHIAPNMVGCQFEELSTDASVAINRYLDPAVLGQELRPIPAPEMSSLWYRGPSGTSLFLWRMSDGQFYRMALFVLGTYIQWSEQEGISTGRARSAEELGEVRGIVRFETMLLEQDVTPDRGKLEIAKTLVTSSQLPQDLKRWCVRQLS
ncbi:MAG TPA: hypothetical protein DCS07_11260 [Bdellovibrionales bacterium]|nr:MAG: hypothetical protein A2Z97_14465 [Bdellovibrionales bacterium GWB1_52_6]OFZ05966.1 MAG: hypothetical protein A2X97_01345 [Bdellovibrionales bacterium GWA1_52_35]OFZ36472.1 MAG: hypothetical protein A2070_09580 [Bdellovibrionales bacterium GWC1_52_8]HAR43186.1 hypothetical protein [Bdellovibrionales bacterium]HCM39415.1 hypothetical protein [Bdellovibrionales bacterium]